MVRLGLCCKFYEEPIKFRTTTAKYTERFDRSEQLKRLSLLCLENARSLLKAIEYCGSNNIGCFRVNSRILPLKTHPDVGYALSDLPGSEEIRTVFSQCRKKAIKLDIRLTFHPDQFVLLSSPKTDVVQKSIEELDYQAEISELIGADVINIHGGGAYGDKTSALKRLGGTLLQLKKSVRKRLTLENDDRVYTPADLLPFCKEHDVPLVYDVHHHRCLPDKLSIKEATKLALKTWKREPLFHLSSPKYGWSRNHSGWHSDYIDAEDFPGEWKKLNITVEVEAKAKELAVKKLYNDLRLNLDRKKK